MRDQRRVRDGVVHDGRLVRRDRHHQGVRGRQPARIRGRNEEGVLRSSRHWARGYRQRAVIKAATHRSRVRRLHRIREPTAFRVAEVIRQRVPGRVPVRGQRRVAQRRLNRRRLV